MIANRSMPPAIILTTGRGEPRSAGFSLVVHVEDVDAGGMGSRRVE